MGSVLCVGCWFVLVVGFGVLMSVVVAMDGYVDVDNGVAVVAVVGVARVVSVVFIYVVIAAVVMVGGNVECVLFDVCCVLLCVV